MIAVASGHDLRGRQHHVNRGERTIAFDSLPDQLSPYETDWVGCCRVPRSVSLSFIEPMMPMLVEKPPAEGNWIYEVKFDGFRTQIVKDGSGVRIFTRNGYDWTSKYWPIALTAEFLSCRSAIIDGEIIVMDEAHRSSFHELRAAIRSQPSRLVFVAFDLLHLDGKDLRRQPLWRRRELLRQVIQPGDGRIEFSEELPGTGEAIFAAVDAMGLEGMISKRRDSTYVSGPAKGWQKIKCFAEDDFDLIGIQREAGKPAMAMMARQGRYVGGAFITLNREMRERLWERIEAMRGKPPKGAKASDAQWIKPGLVGRVRFLKGEKGLRHATLRDWRVEDQ